MGRAWAGRANTNKSRHRYSPRFIRKVINGLSRVIIMLTGIHSWLLMREGKWNSR